MSTAVPITKERPDRGMRLGHAKQRPQFRDVDLEVFPCEGCFPRSAGRNRRLMQRPRAWQCSLAADISTGMVIDELRMNPHQDCLGHVLTLAGYETSRQGKGHLWGRVPESATYYL
jgi:hypothetical protein